MHEVDANIHNGISDCHDNAFGFLTTDDDDNGNGDD